MERKVIPRFTVAIIGAGLAGLTAGVCLAKRGFRVRIFEKNALSGGRTFSFSQNGADSPLDNGQHILMGCYPYTLQLLNELHSCDVTVNRSILTPVHTIGYQDQAGRWSINRSLAGLMTFRKWSLSERLAFLYRFRKIIHSRSAQDLSIGDRLKHCGQTENHIRYFWEPLSLAIMNETVNDADPGIFFDAIRKIFSSDQNQRIFIPAISLYELFIQPALKIIEDRGGDIRYQSRADRIISSGERVEGIELSDGQVITADYYISAAPVWDLANILSAEQQQRLWSDRLSYQSSPIVSAYIRYHQLPECFDLSNPMTGCFGEVIQWVFVRSDNTVAITISAANTMIDETMENLKEKIKTDLRLLFGERSIMTIKDLKIIKQRQATFSLRHDKAMFRPPNETALKNFFIAGDWTDTGLPSTIESAVQSGYTAAEKILSRTYEISRY